VIEAVRISRSAYPNRITYTEFASRFGLLAKASGSEGNEGEGAGGTTLLLLSPSKHAKSQVSEEAADGAADGADGAATPTVSTTFRTACGELMERLNYTSPYFYQLGVTKIYFARRVLEQMELRREQVVNLKARRLQKMARGWLARRTWGRTRKGFVSAQACLRRMVARKRHVRSKAGVIMAQARLRGASGRRTALHAKKAKAAAMLQALTRGRTASKRYSQARRAALWVQAASRRRVALRQFEETKKEAARRDDLEYQLKKLQQRLSDEISEKEKAQANLETAKTEAKQQGKEEGAAAAVASVVAAPVVAAPEEEQEQQAAAAASLMSTMRDTGGLMQSMQEELRALRKELDEERVAHAASKAREEKAISERQLTGAGKEMLTRNFEERLADAVKDERRTRLKVQFDLDMAKSKVEKLTEELHKTKQELHKRPVAAAVEAAGVESGAKKEGGQVQESVVAVVGTVTSATGVSAATLTDSSSSSASAGNSSSSSTGSDGPKQDPAICGVCNENPYLKQAQLVPCCRCASRYHTSCVGLKKVRVATIMNTL
jgi:myosin-5